MKEWMRHRKQLELEEMIEEGEIDELDYKELMEEWEDGWDEEQYSIWEAKNDR